MEMSIGISRMWRFLIIATIAPAVLSGESPAIMIVAPQGPVFEQVTSGLDGELDGSFDLIKLTYNKELTAAALNEKVASAPPKAIVLMGNKTIRFYKEYVAAYRNKKNDLPTVTLLASQMEEAVEGLDEVQGIAYETPMVTALINFRSIIGKPINKVGVMYRSVFESFVKQHTEYCKREKIEIRSILIGNEAKSHKKEIDKALEQLIRKDKVEVVWIPNDNILLKPELLGEVWIPTFMKNTVPVIVGVEALVKPDLNFGTYAVIPDPKAMGEQAAGIIFDLEESDWRFGKKKVFPAISVYSVLNMKKALAAANNLKINVNEVSKVLE